MRYRSTTTGGLTDSYTRSTRTRTCSSSWSSWTNVTTYGGLRTVKEIEDVKTPGFAALRKIGRFLPLNPVEIKTTVDQALPITWTHQRSLKSCNPVKVTAESIGPSAPNVFKEDWGLGIPELDSALQAAVNAAVAESRTAIWDTLTFAAEFKKTSEYVKGRTRGIFSIADKAIDRALSALQQLPRTQRTYPRLLQLFSRFWLEYRYAILPLMYDIKDAVKAVEAQIPQMMRKGRGFQLVSDFVTKETDVSSPQVLAIDTETLEYEVKVRGWAASEFYLEGRFGFDPLITAWELLPFSFVVDWLIQVGTWIEAISPFAQGRTLGSCGSVRIQATWSLNRDFTARDDSTTYGSGSGSGTSAIRFVDSYFRAAREPSLPGWNPRLNLPRITDLLALIIGLNASTARRLRI